MAPPVDKDFFQILQMSETGRTGPGRELLAFVRDAYGPALDVGMEMVFNHLDAARTFHSELKVDPGPRAEWPTKLLSVFREVLPQLLLETARPDCDHHYALATSLGTIDAVISLNYDCVMDRALRTGAGARFSATRGGYGVSAGAGANEWRGRARGHQPKGSIRLLKLHGSINWAAPGKPLAFRGGENIYKPLPEGVIQPPLANKTVTNEPFRSIWREARRAVRTMRRLVVVGYSMPDADGLVRTLLTTDLSEHLQEVIIAEPNAALQRRHIDLFTRRAPKAKVFAFPSWEDLGRVLADR